MTFYGMQEYLLDLFDKNSRKLGFFGNSKEELELWQKNTVDSVKILSRICCL